MATWHQEQAQTRLWHATKFTVVENPPNDTQCLTLCDSREQADARAAIIRALHPTWSVYVLNPPMKGRANTDV